jgi:hypothetical protein
MREALPPRAGAGAARVTAGAGQDDDARFIAGAAKSHAHLRQLGLSGCALTRTGVEAFAQAAGSARSALHTLVLSRNPAVAGDSPAELDALRALFPPHVALRV